jgi:hypothetical protein
MNGKRAKYYRKAAKKMTLEDAPYEEFETKNQNQIVPPNHQEYLNYQAALTKHKEDPENNERPAPVVMDFNPIIIATFVLTWGCTRNIYKQLKAEHKGKPIPMPYHVKNRLGLL